jgi:hypothetical protein
MFRVPPHPSSEAYNCISSFWFYRWSVVVAALLVAALLVAALLVAALLVAALLVVGWPVITGQPTTNKTAITTFQR